jgi:photosystem II stability/assembly factor-like uncharacterized protein
MRIYAATNEGVVTLDDGSATGGLDELGPQCVDIDPTDPDRAFVGTFDNGLFRTRDGGRTWEGVGAGIDHPRVLSVTVLPDGVVLAGTEPSAIFRSDDDGASWRELTSFADVPSRETWFFPPRPWTHHVRWMAPHADNPDEMHVGIELGGVLRTRDGGRTFEDRHPDAVIDPHVVHAHAVSPRRIYAIGGDGVSFSTDGGDTWTRDADGMDRGYTWGLAVDPDDPDLWYVSSAPGPDRAHGGGDAQARLYRKRGSQPWTTLRSDDPLEDMPYALASPRPGTLVVGMHTGEVLISDDAGDSFETIATLRGVLAIAVSA